MDYDKLTQNFERILNSPEGKALAEAYWDKYVRTQKHTADWVEKLKYHYGDNMDSIIEKLLSKYESRKYRDKEYKQGYEPREKLLWLVWEYAIEYGKECPDNIYDIYVNSFTGGMRIVGSYVVQIMYGQGAVLRFDKIES